MSIRILSSMAAFMLVICSMVFAQETVQFDDSWGEPGLQVVSQTATGVELVYSVPSIGFHDFEANGETMTQVHLPGALLGNDAGAPNLPGISRYIAVPRGASVKIEMIESRQHRFDGLNVAPALPIPRETEERIFDYEKDPAIYSRSATFPARQVFLLPQFKLRGVDVVLLNITPFAYNPVQRDLAVFSDFRISIQFDGGNGVFGEERLRSRWFEPLFAQHLINYDSLPPVDFHAPTTRDPDECEYMIFVPDDADFISWAGVIKEFREKQGITTNIFNINDLGGTANSIENKINDAYYNWGAAPSGVLMLGDVGDMPVKTWSGYCYSDNIYADVNGDDLPDLNIARITARNNSELDLMINKFIDYETNPPTGASFYDEPVMAGGWQTERWFILCTEVIFGFHTNSEGKSPVREYAIYSGYPGSVWSTAPNTSTVVSYFGPSGLGYIPNTPAHLTDWGGNATRVNNDLNSGAFYMLHRDHGWELGWGEPDYDIYDLAGLSNSDLCFVMSINCLTGDYGYSPQCFTEAFHRMQYGALGLIAASQLSYSFVNDTFVWGMHDSMWPHFDPGYGGSTGANVLMPGFANMSGKWYLQASSWPYNTGSKVYTHHLFHLHGDAFMQLYSEVPSSLTVSHDSTMDLAATSFDVTADADSLIAIWFDGNLLGTATGTGSSTPVTIDPPGSTGTVYVTVTKTNHIRYEGLVTSQLGDPPVVSDVTPDFGGVAGGTACTVTGLNFTTTPDTTVTFDFDAASNVVVVDATTLTCDSPAHVAGTVGVTVTNGNGSDTLPGAFTYYDAPSISTISPTNGTPLGGTAVTITGADFAGVGSTTVTFDGTAASSVVVVSSTEITCVAPAHAPGVVDVTVTNDYGSDTLTNAFTYDDPPVITSVSPTDVSTGGGEIVTITGQYFVSGTDVNFGGIPAATVFVVSSTEITCSTPAHTGGTEDVTVTNVNGSDTLVDGITFHRPPVLTSVTPDNGPPNGGTPVTISGNEFTDVGSIDIRFGGVSATSIVVVSSTVITCVTPANSSGSVSVAMVTDFGNDLLPNGFTYNPAPSISAVAPADGPISGGTLVTITGADLNYGGTTVEFDGTAATSVTVVSGTEVTCVTPAHVAATVDVTLSNENGSDTLTGAFTYHDPPVITSLTPTDGRTGGGDAVSITGQNFTSDTEVDFGGVPCSIVVVVSSTEITCQTPGHSSGTVDVRVTNDYGSDTLVDAFTFHSAPVLTGVTPNNGPLTGGTPVTITGHNFTAAGDPDIAFDGEYATSVVVVSSTEITCVTPANPAGDVNVYIFSDFGNDFLTNSFTYNPEPGISSVSPSDGPSSGGTAVTVMGSDFDFGGTMVEFGGSVASNIVVISNTMITCTTPAHGAGPVDVTVTNDNGSDTLAGGFTYHESPQLTAIAPMNGPPVGGTSVTLSGSAFTSVGPTSVTFGGVSASSIVVVSQNTMTCVTPAHAPGVVDVEVTNDFGSDTLSNGYTYNYAPVISGIAPADGSVAGGDSVTIDGGNFTADATVDFDGAPATNVVVVSSSQIACDTPPHIAGSVDVTVTNVNGSGTLTGGFTFHNPPTLSAMSPTTGSMTGGFTVFFSGTDFTAAGNPQVLFGNVPAINVQVLSSTQLSCIAPANPVPDFVDVELNTLFGNLVLPEAFLYLPEAGVPPLNLTDVDTTNLDPGDEVRLSITGQPGSLYMLFLSSGGGPLPTKWGQAGLDLPVINMLYWMLNANGFHTLDIVIPPNSGGYYSFYTHALVDDSPPIWAEGGNNPNGTGSILWGVN